MIPRTLSRTLRRVIRQYPVVTVTGPRQSGKTTLVRSVLGGHEYVSLEDPDQRGFATRDPRGFLAQFEGRVILDEAQRAPDLFSFIQTRVDEEDVPGRFVLTGSQNFLLLRSVGQSLAGRCALLHLLPFSLSELHGREPVDPAQLGERVPTAKRAADGDLMEVLWSGFYPRIHDKRLDAREWLRGYVHTYVERDVRELTNVGDLATFELFLRLCAGRNGQLLNLSSLAVDAGITHSTARRWLSILEASFVVMLLRPPPPELPQAPRQAAEALLPRHGARRVPPGHPHAGRPPDARVAWEPFRGVRRLRALQGRPPPRGGPEPLVLA